MRAIWRSASKCEMDEFLKVLLIIAMSSVKFIAGPVFLYFDDNYNFSFIEKISYSIIGGMLGVLIFAYGSDFIVRVWVFLKTPVVAIFKRRHAEGKINADHFIIRKKKVFNSRNRRLVRIWSNYGIIGIAFVTPILLSIPVGTFIATRLIHNKKKVMMYMFISIVFWSFLMISIFELYHVLTLQDLKRSIIE